MKRVRISVWFANCIIVYFTVIDSVVMSGGWEVVGGVGAVGMQFGAVAFVKVSGQMHVVTLCADVTHFTAPAQTD